MSRVIRFIARLYPLAWRRRYGVEFDALLEDVRPDGRTAADVFGGAIAMQIGNWKSWGILAVAALFGAAVIAGLFVANPKVYASKAVLKVEGQGSPHDSLDAINTMVTKVEGPAGLAELITTDNLYVSERSRMTLAELIEQMKKRIHITPVAPSAADFAVVFEYSDPRVAQKVTQDLAVRFLGENGVANTSTTLSILDPPMLPQSPIRPNEPLLAGLGAACFLLMWGALSVVRRIAARGHA